VICEVIENHSGALYEALSRKVSVLFGRSGLNSAP
jgi:hypothetical protein